MPRTERAAVSIEQDMAQRARFPAMLRGTFSARSRFSSARLASSCMARLVARRAACACPWRTATTAAGAAAGGGGYTWRDTTVMQNLPSDGFVLGMLPR